MDTTRNKVISNALYKLADLRQDHRLDASKEILKEFQKISSKNREEVFSYTLERLIKGLASARLAARIGYSTTFLELLKADSEVSHLDVLNKVEIYLPIEIDKENGLGRILALLTIIRATNDSQISEKFCTKVISLLNPVQEKYAHLQTLHVETILVLCSKIQETQFSAYIWPAIKSYCQCSTLSLLTIDQLYLIFELKKLFPKFIIKHAKFQWLKDLSVLEDQSNVNDFINILLSASETCPVVHPGIVSFFETVLAQESSLNAIWPLFVENVFKHQHRTIVSQGFQILVKLLPYLKNEFQVKIIFSKSFFEILLKSLAERNATVRFSRHYALEFVEHLCKFVEENSSSQTLAELVLNQMFEISVNFDRLTNVNFAKRLISHLKDQSADRFFDFISGKIDFTNDNKRYDSENLLKMIYVLFSNNAKNEEFTKKVLNFLADLLFAKLPHKKSENSIGTVASGVFFDCLCLLCDFTLRRRTQSMKFDDSKIVIFEDILKIHQDNVKEESVSKVIKRATKALKKIRKTENNKTEDDLHHGFALLIGYFAFWVLYKPKEYTDTLQELLTCYEEYSVETSGDVEKDSWIDVLMDLFLSILSKPSRHFKVPVDVAFHYLSKRLKLKHLEPVFKVLTTDSDETMELDDEFDPISDNENAENEPSESESISENDDDDESENSFDVDPKFRLDLETTLNVKKAVAKKADNEDDAESVSSDLSDAAMFRLDNQLSEVFRQHLRDKKANLKLLEETERFRSLALDLILIFVRSTSDISLLVQTISPLLLTVKKFTLTKSVNALANRIVKVLQLISDKSKSISQSGVLKDKSVFLQSSVNACRDIFETSKSSQNSLLQNSCSNSLKFILKMNDLFMDDENKQSFVEQLAVLVDQNLNDFLTNPLCLSSVKLFECVFEKHWKHFWYLLPQLAQVIFNDTDVRLFRRKDTCLLCNCFLRHYQTLLKDNLVGDSSISKPMKKLCFVFRTNLIPIFNELSTMFGKKEKDEKPPTDEITEIEKPVSKKSKKSDFSNHSVHTKPHFLTMIFKLMLPVLKQMNSDLARKYFKIESTDSGNDEFICALKNLINASNKWKARDNRFRNFDRCFEQQCQRSSKRIFKDILKVFGLEADSKPVVVTNGAVKSKSSDALPVEKVNSSSGIKRSKNENDNDDDVNATNNATTKKKKKLKLK